MLGAVLCVSLVLFQAILAASPVDPDLSYNEFKIMLEEDKIAKINLVESQDIFIVYGKDGRSYNVINPKYDGFKKELLEKGVDVQLQQATLVETLVSTASIIPAIILAFIMIMLFTKYLSNETDQVFDILKDEQTVTFKDVAGMSEVKRDVKFAVEQLKHYKDLKELGARPVKGIILEGPPGNGKTLMARAIAGEAGVPFINTSGSDFIQMFVGLGAARVRGLWSLAEKNAPCVVFIDEIDAVGGTRTSGGQGGQLEYNQTLNALLAKMDGLDSKSGILVIAATNLVKDLDPALIRPGRFDKQLHVGPPSSKEDRMEIIDLYLKDKKCDETVNTEAVNKLVFGLSGAEIENVLNESVMISLQNGRNGVVNILDIDEASMKTLANGVSIKHNSEKDKRLTAIHESGHAVMNQILGRKVSKVSIIPYSSGIGGLTIAGIDDAEARRFRTKKDMIEDIKVLLAGTVSEEVCLQDISIGASNDLERATEIAYNMINRFGMEEGNLVSLDAFKKSGIVMLDSEKIMSKVNSLLVELRAEVKKALAEHKADIERLANRLMEQEVILEYTLEDSEKIEDRAGEEA